MQHFGLEVLQRVFSGDFQLSQQPLLVFVVVDGVEDVCEFALVGFATDGKEEEEGEGGEGREEVLPLGEFDDFGVNEEKVGVVKDTHLG